MKTDGRPEREYHAQAARGLASGQVRISVVPCGVSGVRPSITPSQLHGARVAQSGLIVPGRTGAQVGVRWR